MISIAFRFDDPSPTSDHALEDKILAIFAKYRFPLTVAVVPFQNGEDGELVKISECPSPHLLAAYRANRIEVAVHGHSHCNRGSGAALSSEFCGLPPEEQLRLIREAKADVEKAFGESIAGFVPPWNSYDRNTVGAVARCRFSYLSAGWDGYERSHEIFVIPRTCTLRTLSKAVNEVGAYSRLVPSMVVVMHPDDFCEYRYTPEPGEMAGFTCLDELDAVLLAIASRPNEFRPVFLKDMQEELVGRNYWCRTQVSWLDRLPWSVKAKIPESLIFAKRRIRVLLLAIALCVKNVFRGKQNSVRIS